VTLEVYCVITLSVTPQRSEYERRMCACVRDLDDEPALISDVLNKCFVLSTPDAPGLDVAQLLAV
jgi:hypothetical protein